MSSSQSVQSKRTERPTGATLEESINNLRVTVVKEGNRIHVDASVATLSSSQSQEQATGSVGGGSEGK